MRMRVPDSVIDERSLYAIRRNLKQFRTKTKILVTCVRARVFSTMSALFG